MQVGEERLGEKAFKHWARDVEAAMSQSHVSDCFVAPAASRVNAYRSRIFS